MTTNRVHVKFLFDLGLSSPEMGDLVELIRLASVVEEYRYDSSSYNQTVILVVECHLEDLERIQKACSRYDEAQGTLLFGFRYVPKQVLRRDQVKEVGEYLDRLRTQPKIIHPTCSPEFDINFMISCDDFKDLDLAVLFAAQREKTRFDRLLLEDT